MDTIMQNWPQLAPFVTSLIALGILCVAVLVQSVLAGALALAPGHQSPGIPLKGGHEDRSFRVMRTYANSTENLPAIIAAIVLAIVAGVNPFWVNLLVGIHVAARLIHWAIYYAGFGASAGGPRTMIYVLGLVANIVLVVMALWALIG